MAVAVERLACRSRPHVTAALSTAGMLHYLRGAGDRALALADCAGVDAQRLSPAGHLCEPPKVHSPTRADVSGLRRDRRGGTGGSHDLGS